MQFSLNYSHIAEDLFRAGEIDVDVWKCFADDAVVKAAQRTAPAYVHFGLLAGAHREIDHATIEKYLKTSDTTYVNMHLIVFTETLPNIDPANTAPATIDAVIDHMLQDLRPMVQRYGADRVIVENIYFPDNINDLMHACVLPQTVNAVVDETGCGLLLDLAHGHVYDLKNEHVNVYDYIPQLPLHALRELHITGTGIIPDGRIGDHHALSEADWKLWHWAMDNIRAGAWPTPTLVACEYGGINPVYGIQTDPDKIREQIPQLLATIRDVKKEGKHA